MADVPPPPVPTQLIVFADDWGRHPSSSQHLIRELLPQYKVLWVNTVGTRRPRLSWSDLLRGYGVVASWFVPHRRYDERDWPEGLRVIAPKMYPGYRNALQRRLNTWNIARAVDAGLLPDHRRVVISTLPTTADLIGRFESDRWVYYCVDDYSQWPGVDHAVMDAMERELVARADAQLAVSDVLQKRLASMGGDAVPLEHGVSVEHWQTPDPRSPLPADWPDERRPIALFWGLIDQRMDLEWVSRLYDDSRSAIVMAGPHTEDASPSLWVWAKAVGKVHHRDLPALAAASQVLIMPYIDAPVTRAMQPLKLKEYLATMKPVVVRDLPSTRAWADCCDIAINAGDFVRLVRERAQTGILPEQVEARKRRLATESWTAKAAQLAEIINRVE